MREHYNNDMGWSLMYCPSCKRKHRMAHLRCMDCNVYTVPQPISETVYSACHAIYRCDGCEAYQDRYR